MNERFENLIDEIIKTAAEYGKQKQQGKNSFNLLRNCFAMKEELLLMYEKRNTQQNEAPPAVSNPPEAKNASVPDDEIDLNEIVNDYIPEAPPEEKKNAQDFWWDKVDGMLRIEPSAVDEIFAAGLTVEEVAQFLENKKERFNLPFVDIMWAIDEIMSEN